MKKRWHTTEAEVKAVIDRELAKTPDSHALHVAMDIQEEGVRLTFTRKVRK